MVVHMRHTRSQSGQRRSHHKLMLASLSVCSHCKTPTASHRACAVCGYYKGRKVIDMEAKAARKSKKNSNVKEEKKEEKKSKKSDAKKK